MQSTSLRRGAALALVAVLVLSTFSGVAAAQSGVGGTIVVEEGQTTNGISAMAGTVVVRGTVDGDVSVLAGTVEIAQTGTVTGDVSGAAGSVTIDGRVDGGVHLASGDVRFGPSSVIGGDVNVGSGTVRLAGTIDGGATVGADQLTVAPTARIAGNLRYDGTLTLQDGATVGGSVVRDDSLGTGPSWGAWSGSGVAWRIPGWLDTIYGFFANLLLGALLLLLFPRFSAGVADTVERRPLRTGAWGLVGLVVTPIVLVLLLVTIIGIPIALVGALLFGLSVWIGVVYGEFAIGRYLLERLDAEGRWYALVLGLLLFSLLGLVPVLGDLAILVALLVGLGALGIALRRAWRLRGDRSAGPETDEPPAEETSDDATDSA